MSTHNQFIYGITMVTTCFVAHFMSKKHFVSLGILLVAVISSTRYMFFRITQTLDFPSWIDMFFGYLLYYLTLLALKAISKKDEMALKRTLNYYPVAF